MSKLQRKKKIQGVSDWPCCIKRQWTERTHIGFEGISIWLGSAFFPSLLTLWMHPIMSMKISYPLFDFSVRWWAFRNLNVSRKVKAILDFLEKFMGCALFSQWCVCLSEAVFSSVRCPYPVGWWHVWKPAEDSGKVNPAPTENFFLSLSIFFSNLSFQYLFKFIFSMWLLHESFRRKKREDFFWG